MVLKIKFISIIDTTINDTLEEKLFSQEHQTKFHSRPYSNYLNLGIVTGIYKGNVKLYDTVQVYSGHGDSDCGVLFEIGKEFIVFAVRKNLYTRHEEIITRYQNNKLLYTDNCRGTTEFYIELDKEIKYVRRELIKASH